MKRSNLSLLVIGVAIILLGFSKADDLLAPEVGQSDQVTTAFTGTSEFKAPIEPGITIKKPDGKILIIGNVAEWYDDSDNKIVKGKSIWYANWLIEADFTSAKVWGKAELFMDSENPDVDPPCGKWEILWYGKLTDGGIDENGNWSKGLINVKAIGQGKSGKVKGMVAEWTYTMNIEEAFMYKSEGIIHKVIEKPHKDQAD